MGKPEQQSDSVLVVDGDVLVRHAIADYLRNCGYTVIEAATTDEGVIVLQRKTLAVHAVLCDAQVPGRMNAFEFRVWAQVQRSELQIALAGNIEAAAHKAAELCDEGPHLARPYDPQSVVSYVRRMLGRAGEKDVQAG